jgi:hypothetical protein
MIEWHKLLGVSFVDYLTNTNFSVEIEKELEMPQFLDYLVLRTDDNSMQLINPPDGMETLARYNLITYKSKHQAINGWSINELIGYYVIYRKIASASLEENNKLLSSEMFKLIAVATRFPANFLSDERYVVLKKGVYRIFRGDQDVDIIVISQLPKSENNAFWHMLSPDEKSLDYGLKNYKWNRDDLHYFFINEYLKNVNMEELNMSYTIRDFKRECIMDTLEYVAMNFKPDEVRDILQRKRVIAQELLKVLPIKDWIREFPTEEILERIPLEERIKGIPLEERIKGIPLEERIKGIPLEERIKGINSEDRLRLLKILQNQNNQTV